MKYPFTDPRCVLCGDWLEDPRWMCRYVCARAQGKPTSFDRKESKKDMKDPLTIADLDLVFLRVTAPDRGIVTVDASQATDAQFEEWAIQYLDENGFGPWSMEQRANFCDQLWQAGVLHIVRRERRAELGI